MVQVHSQPDETMEEPKVTGFSDERAMANSFYQKLNEGTDLSMEDCRLGKTYLDCDNSSSAASSNSRTSVLKHKEPKSRHKLFNSLVRSLFDPSKHRGGLKDKDAAVAKALMDSKYPAERLEHHEEWTINLKKLSMSAAFARGTFGTIFHGRYKGEDVAIKILQRPAAEGDGLHIAQALERQFRQEVMSLANMNHPNVLRFIGACRKPMVWCIVTEYAKGGSLRKYLENRQQNGMNPMPLKLVIKRALDIAKGMEFIHRFGFIHRDLKSDNLLIGSDNSIKVADFGFARIEAKSDAMTPFTGTFRYMAPEMMMEKKRYTQKVDVYSFGIVLWELVAGFLPYDGMTAVQAATLVAKDGVRPWIPDDCLPSLRRIMTRCWDSDPDVRPAFAQIIEMLHNAEAEMMTTVRKARFRGSMPRSTMID